MIQVYWLELDYLDVAEAALHCSASMTALLYIEEWFKEQYKQLKLTSSNSSQVDSCLHDGSREVSTFMT